jgi:predicted TPR repeat methyltransferase
VFANAVLVHFRREETKAVVEKVYQALTQNGRFAFSLQRGDGDAWKENMNGTSRYFCYWQEGQVRDLLKDIGFEYVMFMNDANDQKWMQIIARRKDA